MSKEDGHSITLEIKSYANEYSDFPKQVTLSFTHEDLVNIDRYKKYIKAEKGSIFCIEMECSGIDNEKDSDWRAEGEKILIYSWNNLYFRAHNKHDCWDIIESEPFTVEDIERGYIKREADAV